MMVLRSRSRKAAASFSDTRLTRAASEFTFEGADRSTGVLRDSSSPDSESFTACCLVDRLAICRAPREVLDPQGLERRATFNGSPLGNEFRSWGADVEWLKKFSEVARLWGRQSPAFRQRPQGPRN